MTLNNKKVGFVMTGAFYTFKNTLIEMKKLASKGADILPIMSYNAYELDTKFGEAKEIIKQIKEITGKEEIIHTIQDAEPLGQKQLTDIMIVAPASGNTIAKIANSITDTPPTIAIRSHLRNSGPIVLAISTNDGLGGSAENIGKLLNRKHFYFVPFRQDNPITKPRSLVFDPKYIIPTAEKALEGEQIQPILLG